MDRSKKLSVAFAFAGAILLGWFGSELGRRTGAGSLAVAAFAIGVLCFAFAPVAALTARVRELERRLAVSATTAVDGSTRARA